MCCPGARHRWSKTAVVSTLIELDERGVAWITGTKVKDQFVSSYHSGLCVYEW